MRFLLIILIALFATDARADVTGKAHVIDGNTIRIAGERIRLYGIDAPEMKQDCQARRKTYKCGVISRRALSVLIRGQTVVCKGNKRDESGRRVAKCFVDWLDLGEQMVLIGRALAYRKESRDYARAEYVAKSMKEGMWRGKFVMPWEWRQSNR